MILLKVYFPLSLLSCRKLAKEINAHLLLLPYLKICSYINQFCVD